MLSKPTNNEQPTASPINCAIKMAYIFNRPNTASDARIMLAFSQVINELVNEFTVRTRDSIISKNLSLDEQKIAQSWLELAKGSQINIDDMMALLEEGPSELAQAIKLAEDLKEFKNFKKSTFSASTKVSEGINSTISTSKLATRTFAINTGPLKPKSEVGIIAEDKFFADHSDMVPKSLPPKLQKSAVEGSGSIPSVLTQTQQTRTFGVSFPRPDVSKFLIPKEKTKLAKQM